MVLPTTMNHPSLLLFFLRLCPKVAPFAQLSEKKRQS
ncbi:protein of unknown function [Azospirillum baldaniorum]|uniref:Uncharacterized protein n=1 Tax=Azospirillum baldaniorum TaxID=1064539 RepID=A0A9P1JSX4_9PROT|nr:protein of unknown function [Azospirillum baldaniorum]